MNQFADIVERHPAAPGIVDPRQSLQVQRRTLMESQTDQDTLGQRLGKDGGCITRRVHVESITVETEVTMDRKF